MSKRVALYARYSSDLQNPTSASDQLAALRIDLERRHPDWRIVTEERDEAVSGTSTAGRPGLARLMELAANARPPFDAILVEDVSRFARNRSDALRLREQLAATGVAILSAADGYVDPDSEAGLFLTGIREIKAEADSRETGRRVRRGVGARTRQGWISGRKTPFGYLREPVYSEADTDRDGRLLKLGVRLKAHPLQGPVVTHIFRRHAQGLGLRRIAKELNAPDGPHRNTKPKGFVPSFLRSLLLNPVYRGQLVYGRTRECKVRVGNELKRRKRAVPPEEWVVVDSAHEALVDEETWDVVQARFAESRGKAFGLDGVVAKGGRAPASVLSGLVRCACCDGNFVVWTSSPNTKQRRHGTGRRHQRFACNRARSSGGDLCANRTSIDTSALERACLDALEERVLTADGLSYLEAKRSEYLNQYLGEASGKHGELQLEWAQIQEGEDRVLTAIKAGLPLKGLREEAENLAERRQQIGGEVARLAKLEAAQAAQISEHLKSTRVRHLREVLSAPDLQEVRLALRELIIGIEGRRDGSFWLLVGEGPLGSDDLTLLSDPGHGDGPTEPSPTTESSGPTPEDEEIAAPRGARGAAGRSRICVVGATGFEPATS